MTSVTAPFTDRAGRFSALKTATFVALFLPALWIGWRYWSGDLAPLPVKEALHLAGLWAMRLLLIGLALTPLQKVFGWGRLVLIRRMVGLGAAAYAALHVALYLVMQRFDWTKIFWEFVERRYLNVGLIALAGLAVLAATSTDGMIRRLGPAWRTIHRAVYVITALGLLHFFMQAKIDVSAAVLLAGFLILLMSSRLVLRRKPQAMALALGGAAVAAAALTALLEAGWYGLTTGLSPWKVALANLTVAHGLRPALVVLLTGLAAAIAAWLGARNGPNGTRRIMACVGAPGVLQKRPESARSSAG